MECWFGDLRGCAVCIADGEIRSLRRYHGQPVLHSERACLETGTTKCRRLVSLWLEDKVYVIVGTCYFSDTPHGCA